MFQTIQVEGRNNILWIIREIILRQSEDTKNVDETCPRQEEMIYESIPEPVVSCDDSSIFESDDDTFYSIQNILTPSVTDVDEHTYADTTEMPVKPNIRARALSEVIYESIPVVQTNFEEVGGKGTIKPSSDDMPMSARTQGNKYEIISDAAPFCQNTLRVSDVNEGSASSQVDYKNIDGLTKTTPNKRGKSENKTCIAKLGSSSGADSLEHPSRLIPNAESPLDEYGYLAPNELMRMHTPSFTGGPGDYNNTFEDLENFYSDCIQVSRPRNTLAATEDNTEEINLAVGTVRDRCGTTVSQHHYEACDRRSTVMSEAVSVPCHDLAYESVSDS